ncbi:hypothetical protein ACFO25_10595 [Paenactinomyces guangxiensis]|uniref:Uncharacterized protein n=1 Tax=Paenactinomyces guangxiensis TaxID=1490290 RepID=A0A7W1WQD8_9BACL|nr:hypothetical protein [Paenactinomyces guangxiensis]MBA4494154.1 hypothetical protein [Paenactinomyces guangxiensis]MBH8591101.1 hypothetical protein [Paenactinomyces guangxiensis]
MGEPEKVITYLMVGLDFAFVCLVFAVCMFRRLEQRDKRWEKSHQKEYRRMAEEVSELVPDPEPDL